MYVCFVNHPGDDRQFIFECSAVKDKIAVGTIVACKTSRGLTIGVIASMPIELSGTRYSDVGMLIRPWGANLPLKPIVRIFGDIPDLLPEERREIAKQYIVEVNDLPF